jgi:hypothetical protein
MNHSDDPRQACAAHLWPQAAQCREHGSPLYGELLECAAADCEAGGPTWAILDGHESEPKASVLALRFLGAVHRLVLQGRAPALAQYFPSAGGRNAGGAAAWPAFRDVLLACKEELRALVQHPVQTNEVGRSASLLGGFLTIGQVTGLPLRLLEVGAAAGLNLRWDRYWYEANDAGWGDRASPVRFLGLFEDAHPPLVARVVIAERRGCDARPIDPCSEEGRLTLRSFLWPDQPERRARLDGALAVAAEVPAHVDRADARGWVAERLALPVEGVASVVFHSVVMQYLGREGARQIADTIRIAGARATPAAPLAWLYLEPAKAAKGDWEYRVILTMWPGGEERVVAVSSPHGPPVRWLG